MRLRLLLSAAALAACASAQISVVRSSAAGETWAPQPELTWGADFPSARNVTVSTAAPRHAVLGFGGAFTDTSAYNWKMWMTPALQAQLVEAYWGASGLGYSLGRLHINSPDYAFQSYNLDNVTDDFTLSHFDDALTYDSQRVLPLVKAAMAASAAPMRFFGSPWSPPAWMKKPCACCHDMICSAAAPCLRDDDAAGHSYAATWAQYIVRWIAAFEAHGVPMWGLTPQNEPEAIQQQFESCAYAPADMADFIVGHLGPALRSAFPNLTLMLYDHNKVDALKWAALLSNASVHEYVDAFACHWYDYQKTLGLDAVAAIRGMLGPDAPLLNTEACYLQSLVVDWRIGELYIADILGDLNFGASGWMQWNHVLLTGDKYPQYLGGPNHDGTQTFSDPVLFEFNATGAQRLIFLPSYWIIGHISRYARPGSRVLPSAGAGTAASAAEYDQVRATALGQNASTAFLVSAAFLAPDGAHALVVVANPTPDAQTFKLVDADASGGPRAAAATLPAHSIATFTWAL